MSTRKKRSNQALWVVLGAAAAALLWGIGPGAWFASESKGELRGARVRRGPLRISVLQRGNLAAKDSVSIKSEIEGQTTVIYLIPEGTTVKPGDLLVELDSSDLVEKRVGQEIAVQNAEAAHTKAKAGYEIQESQNKSDIELAERKLKFADNDLKKYVEGDREQLVKKASDTILLAKQKLTQSENTLNWSKSLAEKGFLTKSELENDDLDFKSAKVQAEQAETAKDLLERFDDPRKRMELDANYKEAERGLERAKLRAESMIADYEAGLKSSAAKLGLEREKLTKYLDQLAKTRVMAPVAGMVVYTRGEGGRMGMGEPVQEGSQIRERQEILTIPQTGGMIVEASLHESVLKQVAIGMPCTVQMEALPGLEFAGKVHFVALLADKGSWWMNPNTRLYRTEIQIAEKHPDMRPGMSCNIEILSEEIADTLYVPLQSVVLDKGQTIAFLAPDGLRERIETRPVKVGRNNEKWVEILDGLREGEEVLLSPPPSFQPEGATEAVEPAGAPVNRKPMPDGTQRTGDRGLDGAASGAGRPGANGPDGARADDGSVPGGMRPEGRTGGGRRRGDGSRTEGARDARGAHGASGERSAGAPSAPRAGAGEAPAAPAGGAETSPKRDRE